MRKFPVFLAVFLFIPFALSAKAECIPTPDRSPGMHYKPITQYKQNTGKGLRFSGFVRAAGDCKGIESAKIGHWQANSKGLYDDDQRAYVLSGKLGKYGFNTELPAPSEGRPPHVYFIVIAKGYKTLITRWDSIDPKAAQANMDLVLQPESMADEGSTSTVPAQAPEKNN